ncbi:MFS transporter [Aquamicrobium sp. LC103]|uniref:MFS transporter n=1 Tax=Aquamicrobium sp. LC103 TaxID=1120658 RepID=UPI00063E9F49|nr:MFS transporter [Aquamicrobium sp. LC103]TKT76854.1 MFS transporter [Aquamicrobium sp. LC103]
MPFLSFLRENARWLAGGFLLTYFSSFGQTFFISLSAGNIREEYGLSHGQFGTVYMLATLGSALTMPRFGQIVDRYSARTVALIIMPGLAVATVMMALSTHIVLLVLSIYLLRLFGQGMMGHLAFTTIGKWFAAQRGRAISLAAIGVNVGEGVFPLIFVAVAGVIGWRNSWLAGAAILLLVALPLILTLFAAERRPRSSDPKIVATRTRDWTRGEVVRDPLFYPILICTMASPFIGTTIFFHQIYLVELRGWSLEVFASSFAFMAATTVCFALVSGYLVDRFSAVRLLPVFLLPLGIACLVLGGVEQQWSAFVFMGLLGLTYGFSSTLLGALWPEVYGIRHLGAIRALAMSILVFATAAGPGLTGFLIDLGVSYPLQIIAMGGACFLVAFAMVFVSAALQERAVGVAG